MPTPDYARVAAQLCGYAGWSATSCSPGLAAAIDREVARNRCASIQDYATLLSDPANGLALLQALVEEAAVYESYFFRERERLDWIRDTLLAPAACRSRAPFAVWSAGCAGGEEPYTLSILAHDAGAAAAVRITGTDISNRALDRARIGLFRDWSLRGVADETRERWFLRRGETWQLDPAIVSAVSFAVHNLVSGQPPPGAPSSGFDLVVCRNVLIYFDPAVLERVTRTLIGALAPSGWLVTSVSDPLLPAESAAVPGGVAYRRAP